MEKLNCVYNRVLFIESKDSGLKVLKKMYYAVPDKLVGCVTADDLPDPRSSLIQIKEFCDELVLHYYINILTGKIYPVEQKPGKISYGSMRTAEDGVIDWSRTADEIYNFIRAQSRPYPGAFTYYKKEKNII